MGTFDSVYKNKIRQLEEENRQLRQIINEGRIKDAIDKVISVGKNIGRTFLPSRPTRNDDAEYMKYMEARRRSKEEFEKSWDRGMAQWNQGYQDGLEGNYGHWDDSQHHPDYLRGRTMGTHKRVLGDFVPYHPSESPEGHISPKDSLASAGLDERGSPLGTDHRAIYRAEYQFKHGVMPGVPVEAQRPATGTIEDEESYRFGHHSEY
jgi:hypothetical protein